LATKGALASPPAWQPAEETSKVKDSTGRPTLMHQSFLHVIIRHQAKGEASSQLRLSAQQQEHPHPQLNGGIFC